jgi:hypothetical protein
VGALIIAVMINGLILTGVPDIWQYIAKGLVIIGAGTLDRFRQSVARTLSARCPSELCARRDAYREAIRSRRRDGRPKRITHIFALALSSDQRQGTTAALQYMCDVYSPLRCVIESR